MEETVQTLETDHEDIIHDVKYNYYGTRLATCSSDQKIKVWDLEVTATGTNWKKSAEWKAHSGSIWKLSWAPAEFGNILASCSFDRSVLIFEEEDSAKGKLWLLRATLVDSPLPVTHLQFAPNHLGLKLATCCVDGRVRIYEANDVVNLTMWTLSHDFQVSKEGCNCLCWNPSPFSPQSIAVATNKTTFEIWEFNENQKKWELIPLEDLQSKNEGHKAAINEVSWAPNLGRSFHLIATASKDKSVCIWRFQEIQKTASTPSSLTKDNNSNPATSTTSNNSSSSEREFLLEKEMKAMHESEVWHVEWNVVGTVLASSGDDGIVLLWSRDFTEDKKNRWKNVSKIKRR